MTDAPLTITVSGPQTPLRTKWLTMLRDLVGSTEPSERPQILDAAPGHAESVREFHIHQAARPCLCGSPSCPQSPGRVFRPQDMVDSECIYPNCGCGNERCRATR